MLLAEAADAPAHAPYEYTMATLFLAKAREKAGRAQFQVSVEMGRRAEDYATRARALSGNRSSAVGPSPALVAPAGNPPGLK